ncbi:helix-turn-helix domain-containing protein [Winogradskyella schleiferi]|uniref:helix-turn-helix domain-containing protein n=1 Tax=Winogradskyella schleiferi TaxID=2686078 RepID=UPI0015B92B64|nr:helix-turn-helix domain-containing protein [Winogradskyella schleiferi]
MIPFEQTQQDVAEVKKDLKEMKALLLNKAEPQNLIDDPVPIDKIANLTGYSKATIYGYCQKNLIPHHKKCGRLFFFKSEIVAWIKEGKQKTIKEVEADANTLLSNIKKSSK